jgi:hypothetical protein
MPLSVGHAGILNVVSAADALYGHTNVLYPNFLYLHTFTMNNLHKFPNYSKFVGLVKNPLLFAFIYFLLKIFFI